MEKSRVEVIAEISGSHGGTLENALRLINAAQSAGADAVKFQCYVPEKIAALRGGGSTIWQGQHWQLLDLYKAAHTPREWFPFLIDRAKQLDIAWFSSAFSFDDVDFLYALDCPRFKISSFELQHLQLIRRVAKTERPLILSTGMANMADIVRAVEAAKDTKTVSILHCTSGYPTPPSESRLQRITLLRDTFLTRDIGLSDHTTGIGVPIAAVALGAVIVEKHLRLASVETPDSAFSVVSEDFARMVNGIRDAWAGTFAFCHEPASEASFKKMRKQTS
jgi:sialic acid synthase SpsE